MLPLLIVIVAIGMILEAVSLRRDPSMVVLEYELSRRSAEPGELFEVRVSITNNSRVPISYLAVNEIYPLFTDLPENISYRVSYDGAHVKKFCRISGRKRKKLILETSIKKRGVHVFRGESVEFGDFLGFREISKIVSPRKEIVVYPEKFECRRLTDALGSFCGDLAARRFLIRDPILTVGSREYTGREPMKEIHWLQSAHRGEIMVREYDYTRQLSACVILSVDGIGLNDEEELDGCCAVARTICETLAETGVSVDFFTNARLKRVSDEEVWKCEVSAGRTGSLLEGLGRVLCYSRCSLWNLLEFAHQESDFDAAFIIILPASEKHGREAMERLRGSSGREVMLINIEELKEEAV